MKERLSGEVMLLLQNFEFFFIIYTHSQEFNVWASKIWSPKKKIELLKWTKMILKNIYIGQMNSLVA